MSFGSSQGAIRYVLTIDDSNATQKLNTFKGNLRTLDSSVSSSTRGFDQFNRSIQQNETGTSKLSQVTTALKSNFGQLTTSFGAAMSSVVNLSRSYRDLEDTQIAVDRTALKISRTQEAQAKAQDKLNELINEGKTGTPEYEQALTDLTQAQDAATLAVQMHEEALEAQADTYQDFYLNIVSSAISSIGILSTAIQAFGVSATDIFKKVGASLNGFSLSLKSLTMGGLIGLAITGIALLTQNFLEARAASEALQKQIMELSQTSIDLAFSAIKNSDIQQKTDAINALKKSIADLEATPIQRTFWDNFDSSGGKAFDLRNQQLGKMRSDLALLEKQVYELNNASTTLNATMKQQTWQFNQVNIQMLNYQDMIAQTIAQSKLQADASKKSADALEIARQIEAKLSLEIPLANAKLVEQEEAVVDTTAAWEAYIGAIRSFSDEVLGLDKKGFKDFFKDIGFDKSTIKDLLKQQLKQVNLNDIFSDIRGGIMSFDQFLFKEGDITNWISDLKKRIQKAIKNTPQAQPFAADLLGLTDAKTSEEFKTKFVTLLNKIRGDPALQKAAAALGIDTSTDFANGLGQGFQNIDFSKYIKFDSSGKATTVGNPLAGMITTMTKSIDQAVDYVSKAFSGMKLEIPPVNMKTFAGNMNDAVKASQQTAKKVTKNLEVEWPAIDMDTYAGNLNDAVSAAKDTRKKIEKALQSEIKIKVSFDVDDLPEYKTKTTSSGVKLVKAAGGFQGWVRGGGNGQLFNVAEGGEDEYVSITPKSKMAQGSSGGGGMGSPIQVIVNINGNEIIESKKIVRLIRDVAGRNTSRHL